MCDNKENEQDFNIEELKTIRSLLGIGRYQEFDNSVYKNIMNKLNNKIKEK